MLFDDRTDGGLIGGEKLFFVKNFVVQKKFSPEAGYAEEH